MFLKSWFFSIDFSLTLDILKLKKNELSETFDDTKNLKNVEDV